LVDLRGGKLCGPVPPDFEQSVLCSASLSQAGQTRI
jgi:hypothetical protein